MKVNIMTWRSPQKEPRTFMSLDACQPETLVRTHVVHVQRCAHCGCVSLHMGPFSLRLDVPALESLNEALTLSLATLRARAREARCTAHENLS